MPDIQPATVKPFVIDDLAKSIVRALRATPSLDEKRASRMTLKTASALPITTDAPLVVDLGGPLTGTHWAVRELVATGVAALRVPILGAASGLYLVPQNAPVESLADATAQWNMGSRTIPLPARLVTTQIGAGASFAFVLMWDVRGDELIVPQGWTLRAIVNAALGVAAPGPGAGSTCQLNALGSVENDW